MTKQHTPEQKKQAIDITAARHWLSLESAVYAHNYGPYDRYRSTGEPTEYPWFGCKTDDDLASSIIESANSEGFDPLTRFGLRRTLEIMLHG